MTIAQLAKKWLDHHQIYAKPKTHKTYGQSAKRILGDFGHRRPESLNKRNIDAFVRKLQNDGLANASINVCLRSFKALLNFGAKHGYTGRVSVKFNFMPVSKRQVKNIKSRKDIEKLLAVSKPREQLMFLILGSTGIRLGELLHLQWSDVRDDGSITLSVKEDWSPKNHEERTVYTVDKVLNKLWEYRATQQFNSDEDWIFQSNRRPG